VGVSGTGGAAAVLVAEVPVPEKLRGAAGFFLAAFFLADFLVGFFLPVRDVWRKPFAPRVAFAALLPDFLGDVPRLFVADLRPAALPAAGRVSFFFLPCLLEPAFFVPLPAVFFALAILAPLLYG
jgi:hypothetical protein